MKQAIWGAIAALTLTAPAQAEHLAPRNECGALPGAEAFQMRLATALANRDEAMLRSLVHPQVQLDFGGGSGWDEMRARLVSPDYDLWSELDIVIRLGCAPSYEGSLAMPFYWGQEMPEGYDAYGTYIVLGEKIPLYRSATGDEIERNLSWEAVENVAYLETVEGVEDAARWEVQTADRTRGYVDREKLRALIDYRLLADRNDDGKWQITYFIAGD